MKKRQTKNAVIAKRTCKCTNEIIEDHGDWLLVDVSTPKFPDATMAVDTGVFESHEGGRIYASHLNPNHKYIYALYHIGKKVFSFHRDVIEIPDGLVVDHIAHGSMEHIDNRCSNLRVVSRSQNGMNRRKFTNNTSGMSGVFWDNQTGMWRVQIAIDGKRKSLGYFDNIDFAIGVRQQAEREYFGEFAYQGAK
jgi:hypothetical protein